MLYNSKGFTANPIVTNKRDIQNMKILASAPQTFYAADIGVGGGIINAWSINRWITPTGETKEVWYQTDDDTMKKGTVKQWRKRPGVDEKLTEIIPALEHVLAVLTR